MFLRAFDDDGKRSFQPRNWLARIHGIFAFRDLSSGNWLLCLHPVKIAKLFFNAERHSVEELLSAGFRERGPMVAIGRPGEILESPGADRMYVADDKWQEVVLEYLESSQAIVIQPATTASVHWEIQQVFGRVPRHRILISMLNFKDRPNQYEGFRETVFEVYQRELPLELPFQDTPSLLYFEPDGTLRSQPLCYRSPFLWTFVGNAVDTDRTLHAFMQGLDGRQRELPQAPLR